MSTQAGQQTVVSPPPNLEFNEGQGRDEISEEVVIMENDERTEGYIIEALENLGLKPRTVENSNQAVDLATKKVRCFILDASMGQDRAQEGIEALTRIKKVDKSIFVSVYSNHEGLLEKARKQGADVVRSKSGDHMTDVVSIIAQAAPYLKGLVEKLWQTLGHHSDPPNPRTISEPPDMDINQRKYYELRTNPSWLKQHFGYYIAIIEGKLEDFDVDRRALLKRVRKVHSGKRIFFTEIKEQEELVRVLTPLRIDEGGS